MSGKLFVLQDEVRTSTRCMLRTYFVYRGVNGVVGLFVDESSKRFATELLTGSLVIAGDGQVYPYEGERSGAAGRLDFLRHAGRSRLCVKGNSASTNSLAGIAKEHFLLSKKRKLYERYRVESIEGVGSELYPLFQGDGLINEKVLFELLERIEEVLIWPIDSSGFGVYCVHYSGCSDSTRNWIHSFCKENDIELQFVNVLDELPRW